MYPDQVHEIGENEILRKHLAKWMAQFCFRDTKLEDLHDRISDEEMQELMIDCVNHSYAFLTVLFSTPRGDDILELFRRHDPAPEWNEPEMPAKLVEGAKQLEDLGIIP